MHNVKNVDIERSIECTILRSVLVWGSIAMIVAARFVNDVIKGRSP